MPFSQCSQVPQAQDARQALELGQAGFWSQPPPSATWLTDQSLPHSAPSLRVLICEMGRLSCLPLCAAVRIKQDGVDGAAGTDFMVVTVELPHPTWATLVVTVPQPWSQGFWEGDSASLLAQPAWPLTFSTQAVKAACLPARGVGGQGGAPASSSPAARPRSHSSPSPRLCVS